MTAKLYKRIGIFLLHPRVPWKVLSFLKRVSPTAYRLARYGRVNPNTRAYWNRVYASEIAAGDMRDHSYSALHAAIVTEVAGKPSTNSRLLDVGCGTGALLNKLRPRFSGELYGCDLAPVAVEAVRDICKDARVVCLPALPQDWNSRFDYVICTEVLEHLSRPEQAIASMAQCLRAGGKLILSVPNDSMHPDDFDEHVQSFDAASMSAILRKHFEDVDVRTISGDRGESYLLAIGGSSHRSSQ